MIDCKKQVVTATIITPTGERFVGRNWIRNDPGDECPRVSLGCKTGEGYDLCASVCDQMGHAEIVALGLAGERAQGATLYLQGHTYACEPCKAAAEAAGVHSIIIDAPPEASE